MSETPLWFGPADRPRFGWLHTPVEGVARAGVVLCPPSGYEYVCAHRTFRVLAQRLADAGYVALRFDYDGTGDSAGDDHDPERVAAWLTSVRDAVGVVRSTGMPSVGLVGMRLGATLAACVAAEEAVDALVLWDPVWSGRAFVRQLRALHLVAVGGESEDEGVIEVAGTVYARATVDDIRALAMPDLGTVACPLLVMTRPDSPVGAPSAESLPPGVTLREATGQDDLLDHESSMSRVPRTALAGVTEWLASTLVGEATTYRSPPSPESITIAPGLTERVVELGPLSLIGVITEGEPWAGRPTVVLLNNATDHHIGPSRLWVEWGRRLAGRGFRVARIDLSGLGDSPARSGQAEDRSYAPEAVEDVTAIGSALDDGDGVVLVGLCSGGRHALEGGARIPARAVCAINVTLHLPNRALAQITNETPVPPLVARLSRHHRYRHQVYIRTPPSIWRMLDRVGLMPSRARLLDGLAAKDVDTLLIYGADEGALFRLKETSGWALRRLERRSDFRLEIISGLEHALMRRKSRAVVTSLVEDHLSARFAGPSRSESRLAHP